MPTPAELERLDALVRRLTPLSTVQRGQLIRAEGWNILVSALIEVARAVLAEAKVETVPGHEHVDQVVVGWLDPRLRALIERGPLAEPTSVARLDTQHRRIGQSIERMNRLEETIREARRIASDIADRDVKRETDLNTIRRTVEGLPDAREDVLTLRETLRSIQTDVKTAIDVGQRLEVNGQPFDAAAFNQRLQAVEELRHRLTAPNGDLFDAAAVERRLSELNNTFITPQQLEEILNNRRLELPAEQFADLENRLTASLAERFDQRVTSATDALRAEIAEHFGAVDGIVGRAVSDALPNLRSSILEGVSSQIDTAITTSRGEIEGLLEQRFSAGEASLLTQVDDGLASLRETLSADLTGQFDALISGAIAPLQNQVNTLSSRVQQIRDTTARVDSTAAALATRIEVVAREGELARQALQTALLTELDRRLQTQLGQFTQQIEALKTGLQEQLKTMVGDAVRSLSDRVQAIAISAVRSESNAVTTRLRGEMREVARAEINAALIDLRTDVNNQITAAFSQLPGLVSAEVRRATANLPELVRTEIDRRRIPGTNPPIPGGGGQQ